MMDNSENANVENGTTERHYLSSRQFASRDFETANAELSARLLASLSDGRSGNFGLVGCTSSIMSGIGRTDGQDSVSIASSGYCCELCQLDFPSASALSSHNLLVHRHGEESSPNPVVVGEDVIASKKKRKTFECRSCGKCFSLSSYLSQHSRIHLGVKNYRCEICDRRFTQMCHLQQHIRTHTGAKPYVCCHSGCDKSFSQLSNLQSHTRSHMTDKPFRCTSCYMCFSDEPSLHAHMPRHDGAKRNKTKICTICGKSYVLEKYLEQHILKNHSGNGTSVKKQSETVTQSKMHNDDNHGNVESPSIQPQGLLSHDVRSMLQPNAVDRCEQTFDSRNVQQPMFLHGSYFQNLVHNVGNNAQDLDAMHCSSFNLPLIGGPSKSEVQLGGTDAQSSLNSILPTDVRNSYTNGISSVHANLASSNHSAMILPDSSDIRIQRHSIDSSSFAGIGPMNDVFPRLRPIESSSAMETATTTPSFNPSVKFESTAHTNSLSVSDSGRYQLDLINSVIFGNENATTPSFVSSSLLNSWMMPSGDNYNNYDL